MTEANYLGLALWFLRPSIYFIITGVRFARQIDRNLLALGLIPGIGLVACASDFHDLLSRLPLAQKRRGAVLRSDVQTRLRVLRPAIASLAPKSSGS